jgi:hypothetical protein
MAKENRVGMVGKLALAGTLVFSSGVAVDRFVLPHPDTDPSATQSVDKQFKELETVELQGTNSPSEFINTYFNTVFANLQEAGLGGSVTEGPLAIPPRSQEVKFVHMRDDGKRMEYVLRKGIDPELGLQSNMVVIEGGLYVDENEKITNLNFGKSGIRGDSRVNQGWATRVYMEKDNLQKFSTDFIADYNGYVPTHNLRVETAKSGKNPNIATLNLR